LQLSRLRRGYEKLQSKQRRETRGEASKRQGEDESEMSRLTRKLEVCSEKTNAGHSLYVLTDFMGFTDEE